jgi:hypothetical protein
MARRARGSARRFGDAGHHLYCILFLKISFFVQIFFLGQPLFASVFRLSRKFRVPSPQANNRFCQAVV